MIYKKTLLGLCAPLLLAGCATYPRAPSVMVLPGTTANFAQFRADEAGCKAYAQESIGGQGVQQEAQNSAVNSAAVGTMLGAAAGALIGAASGNAGTGAAIGAGGGLVLGGAGGSEAYEAGGGRAQSIYDNAYVQCMYARGHQVPVAAGSVQTQPPLPAPAVAARPTYTPPPGLGSPGATAPYPPAGLPPPPGY